MVEIHEFPPTKITKPIAYDVIDDNVSFFGSITIADNI